MVHAFNVSTESPVTQVSRATSCAAMSPSAHHQLVTTPRTVCAPPPLRAQEDDDVAALAEVMEEVEGLRFPLIVKHHHG
jgi:hypothetical protein